MYCHYWFLRMKWQIKLWIDVPVRGILAVVLFPGSWPLLNVDAIFFAQLEKSRPALVRGVVSLQPATLQAKPSHLHHGSLGFDILERKIKGGPSYIAFKLQSHHFFNVENMFYKWFVRVFVHPEVVETYFGYITCVGGISGNMAATNSQSRLLRAREIHGKIKFFFSWNVFQQL